MIRGIFSFLGGIFAFATLCAISAVLGVIGIFFAFGRDLPNVDQLATYEPATISRVYSVDGQVIDEFAHERRLFTPADEIPDIVKQAFISAEDKSFYTHDGYDPLGILKAFYDAAQGARLRGASTITQQVTKNFLLDGSRRIERKVKEIILATRIEHVLSKPKILELYLNEIFLGQNSYGVTAAADTYFGKPIEDITIAEAAYLAALPKAPSTYHPVRERKRAIARRNFVLREMYENGFITQDEYQVAKDSDLITVQSGDFVASRTTRQPRGYFTDEIRRQLSKSFGEDEFFTGGMAVRATMDPQMQEVAAQALRAGLEAYDRKNEPWRGPLVQFDRAVLQDDEKLQDAFSDHDFARDIDGWHLAVITDVTAKEARFELENGPQGAGQVLRFDRESQTFKNRIAANGNVRPMRTARDFWAVGDVIYVKPEQDAAGTIIGWSLRQIPAVQGAFVAMDPHTGRVIAMQGGFSYQDSVFNRVTQALRQPGSSFKPFVYASALDSGYSPASIVVDAPIAIDTPQGLWRPKNSSDKYYGPAPMRVGIERSRNLMTIRLAQDVGMDVVAKYAERFGVYDNMNEYLALSLGAQESTLYRMVAAYAMFANGGERVQPTLVDRVQDRFGRSIFIHDPRVCLDCRDMTLRDGYAPRIQSSRERIMDPITAYQLTMMMEGVVQNGTGRSVAIDGVPIAGKTGTTNEARDVWFIGFTKNLVAGCYVGFDQPQPLAKGSGGGSICGPIFRDFMLEATKKYGSGAFNVPEGGHFIKFDRASGVRLADDAEGPNVIEEFFRDGDDTYLNENVNVIDGGFSASVDIEIFNEFINQQLTREEQEALDEERELAQQQALETGEVITASTTQPQGQEQVQDAQDDARTNFGSLTSGGTY